MKKKPKLGCARGFSYPCYMVKFMKLYPSFPIVDKDTLWTEIQDVYWENEFYCLPMIKKNNKWGAVNADLELIIPIENDTLIPQCCNLLLFKKDNLWGVYNKDGKLLIPNLYKKMGLFTDGLSFVETTKGAVGYLGINGKEYFEEKKRKPKCFSKKITKQ